MAAKSNTYANALLLLLFNNTAWANIGDAAGLRATTTAGSLYWGLHTSSPGAAGDQTTNEISYTGYARVAGARSSGGFTVTAGSVSPAAAVTFGQMTAGTGGTVTHFGLGSASSGAGILIYFGTVTPNISTVNGVTPQLTTASAITET